MTRNNAIRPELKIAGSTGDDTWQVILHGLDVSRVISGLNSTPPKGYTFWGDSDSVEMEPSKPSEPFISTIGGTVTIWGYLERDGDDRLDGTLAQPTDLTLDQRLSVAGITKILMQAAQ